MNSVAMNMETMTAAATDLATGAVWSRPLPALSGRRSALSIGVLGRECPIICLHEAILDRILEYSEESPDVETGGFLIGCRCRDKRMERDFLDVSSFLPATSTGSAIDSLTFTHETWSRLHREISEQFPESQIVGWHHTHPGFGIFLSRHDEFIHRHFFSCPWHIALVVDPKKGEFGFFQWQGGELVNTGFLLIPASAKRKSGNARA